MTSNCKIHINYGALPKKSVTLSVTALDALTRALSLSSYFIFISKNPVGNNRGKTVVKMDCDKNMKVLHS